MIFNEIYGAYYTSIAQILKKALSGAVTEKDIQEIVSQNAFSESALAVCPALREERWQLLNPDGTTSLTHTPTMPLTTVQKRWLKAISLDPRIKLFGVSIAYDDETEPLFTNDDYCIFDKYSDGDNFEDEEYIKTFSIILDAVKTRKALKIEVTNRHRTIINLGRITKCEYYSGEYMMRKCKNVNTRRSVTIELFNERNALERVMLHFSHFEKEAEKLENERYRVRINYHMDDETEMVIRVLSFGPLVWVVEPDSFIRQIKRRLTDQKIQTVDKLGLPQA